MVAQAVQIGELTYSVAVLRRGPVYAAYRLTRPDGRSYDVVVDRAGYFCSCPDATYRKHLCKHALFIRENAMTETLPATVQHNGPPARANQAAEVLERVIAAGDLSRLSAEDRTRYYVQVCDSLGLNPATRPFEYIVLNGKMVLYARRDATEQLRRIHKVSIQIVARERHDDLYVVTARATMPDGRTDESVGAVSLAGLKGEGLSNGIMKCETKAKRRVTLSIVGLGFLDESEVPSVSPPEQPAGQTPLPAPAAAAERPRQLPATAEGVRMNQKQMEQIDSLQTELHVTNDSFRQRIAQLYGTEDPGALTAAQAADLIKRLEDSRAGKSAK